jgi:hypothetical protein
LYNHFTTWSGFPCALPSDEIFLKELEFWLLEDFLVEMQFVP